MPGVFSWLTVQFWNITFAEDKTINAKELRAILDENKTEPREG
jgi:hypothetical protein